MKRLPQYTAVIRTLGKAGEKYQKLLTSLIKQTHKPSAIIVYLAEGYEKPKETVGVERIVYVPKGMVAQRALEYKEVSTDWILFLDDDIEIEPWGVEVILSDTLSAQADVCAIDGFPHHSMPLSVKFKMAISLSCLPRWGQPQKGYTLSPFGVELYNPNPKTNYAWSNVNSGNAFICRKKDFLKINFREELWLDDTPYAFPDDRVMFYKMHLAGLKIITHYRSGFKHLDAKTAINSQRASKLAYSVSRNEYIFSHLYFLPNLSGKERCVYRIVKIIQSISKGIVGIIKLVNGIDYSEERKAGILSAKAYLKQK